MASPFASQHNRCPHLLNTRRSMSAFPIGSRPGLLDILPLTTGLLLQFRFQTSQAVGNIPPCPLEESLSSSDIHWFWNRSSIWSLAAYSAIYKPHISTIWSQGSYSRRVHNYTQSSTILGTSSFASRCSALAGSLPCSRSYTMHGFLGCPTQKGWRFLYLWNSSTMSMGC